MATMPPPPEICLKCGADIPYVVDPLSTLTPHCPDPMHMVCGPTEWIRGPHPVCQSPPNLERIREAEERQNCRLRRLGINVC